MSSRPHHRTLKRIRCSPPRTVLAASGSVRIRPLPSPRLRACGHPRMAVAFCRVAIRWIRNPIGNSSTELPAPASLRALARPRPVPLPHPSNAPPLAFSRMRCTLRQELRGKVVREDHTGGLTKGSFPLSSFLCPTPPAQPSMVTRRRPAPIPDRGSPES
jgi:hypothetical protein